MTTISRADAFGQLTRHYNRLKPWSRRKKRDTAAITKALIRGGFGRKGRRVK